MFTISQIKEAHAKVRSGADFPAYVQDLKQMGVAAYEHYVADGHTLYRGTADFRLKSSAKYPAKEIAETGFREELEQALRFHQQGETDYLTFCQQAAEAGVEKWLCDFARMTCSYFDKKGTALAMEQIPFPNVN